MDDNFIQAALCGIPKSIGRGKSPFTDSHNIQLEYFVNRYLKLKAFW
jgi:hypothetical protein